jgi:hypothetical protein
MHSLLKQLKLYLKLHKKKWKEAEGEQKKAASGE